MSSLEQPYLDISQHSSLLVLCIYLIIIDVFVNKGNKWKGGELAVKTFGLDIFLRNPYLVYCSKSKEFFLIDIP